MKSVYTPVLISFEWTADPYIIGRDKIFHPATDFVGKVWVTNDWGAVKDAQVEWSIVEKATGNVACSHAFVSNLDADSNVVIDHVVWPIPADARGEYVVRMKVSDGDTVLSENYTDIIVR
jgi:beta-mannosidase